MSRHGIDLEKGECVEVTSGIRRIMVGCGWDPHKERSRHAFDLDVACVLLEANGKMASRKEFVYYGNKQYGAETVVHTGDNLTGEGDGDDERILMDLTTIPTSVTQIDIFVAIYQARAREQSFGMISDCYIRIVDVSCEEDCTRRGPLYNSTSYPGREFCRFNIDEGAANCDCVQFGTLHRTGRGWQFQAVQKEIYGGFDAILSAVAPTNSNNGNGLTLDRAVVSGTELVTMARSQAMVLPQKLVQACSDNKAGILLCALAYLVFNIGLVPLCLLGGAYLVFSRVK